MGSNLPGYAKKMESSITSSSNCQKHCSEIQNYTVQCLLFYWSNSYYSLDALGVKNDHYREKLFLVPLLSFLCCLPVPFPVYDTCKRFEGTEGFFFLDMFYFRNVRII